MIHVLGNAAIDTLIRLDRFPRPGETIVARGAVEDLGGKGANQSIVIARCGQRVRLLAPLGDDPQAERIRRALKGEGVKTDRLTTWPGATDRCLIYVDAEGENAIVSLIDAARAFDPIEEGGFAEGVAQGDWLLMQGNLRPEVTRACLALAKRERAITALNPSPTYASAEYDWRLVDLLIVNRGEASELGGQSDPFAAARALCEGGAGAVALTLGREGAALFAAGAVTKVSAPTVEAIDTVGAGDVFCGTLIAARAGGRNWDEALKAAVAAAAIAVTRRGVLASFPTRDELANILLRRRPEEPSP
jgi:ribokinase